ncbi:MAG: hypothetical protein ACI88Z_002059, partial [Sphingobacteriales bacterium]
GIKGSSIQALELSSLFHCNSIFDLFLNFFRSILPQRKEEGTKTREAFFYFAPAWRFLRLRKLQRLIKRSKVFFYRLFQTLLSPIYLFIAY